MFPPCSPNISLGVGNIYHRQERGFREEAGGAERHLESQLGTKDITGRDRGAGRVWQGGPGGGGKLPDFQEPPGLHSPGAPSPL